MVPAAADALVLQHLEGSEGSSNCGSMPACNASVSGKDSVAVQSILDATGESVVLYVSQKIIQTRHIYQPAIIPPGRARTIQESDAIRKHHRKEKKPMDPLVPTVHSPLNHIPVRVPLGPLIISMRAGARGTGLPV